MKKLHYLLLLPLTLGIFTLIFYITFSSSSPVLSASSSSSLPKHFPEYTKVNTSTMPITNEMYTGFIVIDNNTQSNLFYILYSKDNQTINNTAPLILFLQGGPGSPTDYSCFEDIGPLLLKNFTNPALYSNPHSWSTYSNLLFIDNPIGVGFSQSFNGLHPNTSTESAYHLLIFLIRFYQLYPSLISNPFYIFGESYAGHYIPSFAKAIISNITFMSQINLAGISIGDGWINPYQQIMIYNTFGYSAGINDQKTRDKLKQKEIIAREMILKGLLYNATNQANNNLVIMAKKGGNINMYDYRDYTGIIVESEGKSNGVNGGTQGIGSNNDEVEEEEEYEETEEEIEAEDSNTFYKWLNMTEVQDMLGIPNMPYFGDNNSVYYDYFNDSSLSYANDLLTILQSNISVLLYQGQDDPNITYKSIMSTINSLSWQYLKNFRLSKRIIWIYNNATVGTVKSSNGLTLVTIYKSGHMTPYYQPAITQEMVRRFINDISFTA